MATCSIKTFRTYITPSRNALVDDIEEYLASLTPTYSDAKFQYQQLGLDLNVVIKISQSAIPQHTIGNYCRIVQDSKIWYYFILNANWKSEGAVELKLSIDSINTFCDDLTWDDKTTIARQHEDRLTRYQEYQVGEAVRVIDKQPENISALKLKDYDYTVKQAQTNYDWYLIYKTSNALSPTDIGNPIECLLVADQPLIISKTGGGAAQTLVPTDLPDGQYNYVTNNDNPGFSFTLPWHFIFNVPGGTDIDEIRTLTITEGEIARQTYYDQGVLQVVDYKITGFRFVNTNDTEIAVNVYGEVVSTVTTPDVVLGENMYSSGASLTINELNFTRVTYDGNIPINYVETLVSDTTIYDIGTEVTRTTIAYSKVDKTDSQILKIIKLPYCPVEVSIQNGIFTFPSSWTYTSGYMKLADASLSTEFANLFWSLNPSNWLVYTIPSANRNVLAARNIDVESKLYNSDFYTFKYIYDSFGNEIRWENFDTSTWDYAGRPSINFTFKPTNTINSKFDFYSNYTKYYEDLQDYEGHLIVDRNNEETIFSNDYINYIRTGYNYDKKAKQQSTTLSYLGAAASLVGSVVSFAASTVTGGVSAAAGIALATSAITTFANAAGTQASNERNMESKLAGLKAQSTGVAGADDVDLMSYYSGNRMHIVGYQAEDIQRQAIYNLFFYCGYAHNNIETPNLTSRYWFNYIMCKPVFKEEGITPYIDYIDDIKARYQSGVTVYHHHSIWDWDQQYENWEVNIASAFSSSILPNLTSFYTDGLYVYAEESDADYAPSALNNYRYAWYYTDENGTDVLIDNTDYSGSIQTTDVPADAIAIKCRLIDTSNTMLDGPASVIDLTKPIGISYQASGSTYLLWRNPCWDGTYVGDDDYYYGWIDDNDNTYKGLTITEDPKEDIHYVDLYDLGQEQIAASYIISNVIDW